MNLEKSRPNVQQIEKLPSRGWCFHGRSPKLKSISAFFKTTEGKIVWFPWCFGIVKAQPKSSPFLV